MKLYLILVLILFSFSTHAQEAYIIINEQDGNIILEQNSSDLRYPASLTKLMTIYITFDALSKKIMLSNKKLYTSKKASEQVPTKLNLKKGDYITIKDALDAVIIKSANDAAVVLSENLSGSEKTFSEIMTKAAKQIGLSKTNFENASGLGDDSQVSTAKDLALLGLAIYRHFPQYYHLFSKPSFIYNGIKYKTHNHLLTSYTGTDGMKTGYIKKSGFNILASVKRNNTRLIGVYLGGKTTQARDEAIKKLFDKAFSQLGIRKTSITTGNAYLQLGAFSQKSNAENIVKNNSSLHIENKNNLYIVKSPKMSYSKAYNTCKEIKQRGKECLLKSVK